MSEDAQTEDPQVEKRAFQTEVQQLLHLLVHSLYTQKEIFLRELISNASDALDKIHHRSLTDRNILDPDAELDIETRGVEQQQDPDDPRPGDRHDPRRGQ